MSQESSLPAPVKHYRWSRVHGEPTGPYRVVESYDDVWIEADETLHNPRGYPEDLARAAALRADIWKAERLAESRMRGVETRKRRREARIHRIALRILKNEGIGPQTHCACCRKFLTDPASISRGVGSECWGHLLEQVERLKVEAEGDTHVA